MAKAFLFDLDGTLVDNMHYHLEAWKKVAEAAGSHKDKATIYKSVYGKNTEILARILDDRKLSEEELQRMVKIKDATYRDLYQPHLALIPGVQQFLDGAVEAGIEMAIASGSTPENVNMVLDGLNIRHYFKAIVNGSEVKKSKPDPSTFLLAASKLSIAPENCIVFEDVPQGVEAARQGGIFAVAILTTHPEEAFLPYSNLLETIHDYKSLDGPELFKMIDLKRPMAV